MKIVDNIKDMRYVNTDLNNEDKGIFYICDEHQNFWAWIDRDAKYSIEFKTDENAMQFIDRISINGISKLLHRQKQNLLIIDKKGGNQEWIIIDCGNNETLAKELVKRFRRQYVSYHKQLNNNKEEQQIEACDDFGVKI